MPRHVRLIPKQRKHLAPPAHDVDAEGALHAVVVDEQTYWTGKQLAYDIMNRTRYTRWYRVVVTNLKSNDEYVIETQAGRHDEGQFIEVEPGQEFMVSIVLGGVDEREPSVPRQFELYVNEYATPEERGQPQQRLHERLQWIPRPGENSIHVTTREEVVKIRPWRRRVRFEASLVNRSYLPIVAEVRALPIEGGKEAGIEGTQELLREPIPPQDEQPVLCEVTMERSLKVPLLVDVAANIDIPTLGVKRTTASKSVQIVPVPLFKIWQDWVVAGIIAFLLFWLLFGMPPFVHPITEVKLTFADGLPAAFSGTDLLVTLTPTSAGAEPANLDPLNGRLIRTIDGKTLVYGFDWHWIWRGPRWTWNEYDLKLKVQSKDVKNAKVGGYDVSAFNLNEPTTIARTYGVSNEELTASQGRELGIALLWLPPVGRPQDDQDITVEVTANGLAVPNVAYDPGRPTPLPDSVVSGKASVNVDIMATTMPSTMTAAPVHLPGLTPRSTPYRVQLTFGAKTAYVSIPSGSSGAPFAYVIKDALTKAVLDSGISPSGDVVESKPIPMTSAKRNVLVYVSGKGFVQVSRPAVLQPDTHAQFGPWTSDAPIGQPIGTGDPVLGGGGGGNGGGKTPPKEEKPKLILKDAQKWCHLLGIDGLAVPLQKASADPHWVQLTPTLADPDPGGNTTLTVTPSEPCWIQIYDISTPGDFTPVHGPGVDYFIGSAEAMTPGAWKKAKPKWITASDQYDCSLKHGHISFVVLGYRPTPAVVGDFSGELMSLLTPNPSPHEDWRNWTITGIEYPPK